MCGHQSQTVASRSQVPHYNVIRGATRDTAGCRITEVQTVASRIQDSHYNAIQGTPRGPRTRLMEGVGG